MLQKIISKKQTVESRIKDVHFETVNAIARILKVADSKLI